MSTFYNKIGQLNLSPKFKIIIIRVNPIITPKICGSVRITPKLKPEYDATILLGPGEQLVPNINKKSDKSSGCIKLSYR